MPDGTPLFSVDVLRQLERAGIGEDEAARDFLQGADRDRAPGGGRFVFGRLCIYEFEASVVFGRRESVIVQVWVVSDG